MDSMEQTTFSRRMNFGYMNRSIEEKIVVYWKDCTMTETDKNHKTYQNSYHGQIQKYAVGFELVV
jgi:hypothetical protein